MQTIFDTSYPVTKMHGCGNDFVLYVDLDESTTPQDVIKICALHTGVGADGVITVTKSRTPKAKYQMKYFNADGSTAEMCGNGIRCFAKYLIDTKLLVDHGEIPVDTDAGIIIPHVLENSEKEAQVKVNMGEPVFYNKEQITLTPQRNGLVTVSLPNLQFKGTYMNMGNPHVIFFVSKGDAEKYAKEYGPQIEQMTTVFPKKTNVEFVEVNNKKDLTLHVWERGAGLTLACGTGACATLAASVLLGYADNTAKVHLPGGTLDISWKGVGSPIYMTGPAVNVFTISDLQKFLLQ